MTITDVNDYRVTQLVKDGDQVRLEALKQLYDQANEIGNIETEVIVFLSLKIKERQLIVDNRGKG